MVRLVRQSKIVLVTVISLLFIRLVEEISVDFELPAVELEERIDSKGGNSINHDLIYFTHFNFLHLFLFMYVAAHI